MINRILINLIYLLLILTACEYSVEEKPVLRKGITTIESISEYAKCSTEINNLIKNDNDLELDVNQRKDLLFSAKAYPVFFVKEPVYTKSQSKAINNYRQLFKRSNPWTFIMKHVEYFKYRTDIGKGVFLKNGYFYHSNPFTAWSMTQLVGLDMMFNEQKIWIQRGSVTMQAQKKKSGYYFVDGPFKDRRATVILFDRVFTEEPVKSLHIDILKARKEYKFSKIEPVHLSKSKMIADVFYKNKKIKSLFSINESSINLICETEDSSKYKEDYNIESLKYAILESVIESIPFDEPKYEIGQEDGKLRDTWMYAFYRGKVSFVYNHDKYYVYGRLGRPRPPQVCVDFIVDSYDRAAGSWYTDVFNRRKPDRISGTFDSRKLRYENEDGEEKHYALRNVDGFTHFVLDHPQWFNVFKIDDKIKIGSDEFIDSYLPSLDLQIGDAIFIKGPVPWDKSYHSHSFFIFEKDPITNFPSIIAGNAGSAAMRPWKMEAARTPNRYIFMIVRPTKAFLNLLSNNVKDIMVR